MSFEKPKDNFSRNLDRKTNDREAALLSPEKEAQLKKELQETNTKLKELSKEFNILAEEDYFYSRQKLEGILDRIKDIKTEQTIIYDKLKTILDFQAELSAEKLQEELDNNQGLKN